MKKYISIILILLMMFVGNNKAVALEKFPSSFTVKSSNEIIILSSDLSSVGNKDNLGETGLPFFAYKQSNLTNKGQYIICISGNSVPDPDKLITYNLVDWSDSKARGVAYIIDKVIGDNPVNYTNYYYAQLLIESYLGVYKYESTIFREAVMASTSTFKIPNTNETYSEILKGAEDEETKEIPDTLLQANNNTLQFTKGNDGYWYANVQITSNTAISFSKISNNKFTYEQVSKKGNDYNYKFKIADSNIALGATQNFEITVNSSPMYFKVASKYVTEEGEWQDLTLAYTINKEAHSGKTLKLTGSVTKPKTSIKVAKVNNKDDLIKDAELVFQTEADYKANKETKKITTTENYITISDLVAGKYYLSEKIAPNGYDKSDKVMVIEISNDGTIKVDGAASNGTIKFGNDLTKTNISKKDATGKNELSGATLHVLDKDKKSMSCTILKDGKEQKLDKCTWVSGTKPVQVIGLAKGKYYLKETIAPNRYVLSEEVVSFEVKGDGSVTNVEMTNKLNKVVISKVNAFTKKELPGATLEIQNEKGEIVKYCLEQEKNPECKWVSTEEPFVIEGLPNGTYYLVETIAPKGFVLNKEKVKFTVDGKTAISYVQMENELEVEVPDTLSSRSVLLVAISMFDIALGIGIISYVKKNKYQE